MASQKQQIQQAFQFIKAGNKQEAVKLLVPVIKDDKTNVNAWWLMANALEDKGKIEKALEAVLRLKPDHEGAQRMLEQMNPPPPADDFDYDDDPFAAPSSAYARDDDPFADDEDDPFAPAAVSGGRRKRGQQNFDSDPFSATAYDAEIDLLRKPKRGGSRSSSNNTVMLVGGIAVVVLLGAIAFLITVSVINSNTIPTGPCEASEIQIATVRDSIQFNDGARLEMRGCIGIGQTRGGQLNDPTLYQGYSFYGEAEQRVSIDLERTFSSSLDTYLQLFDPTGQRIAIDDDGGSGLNSRIVLSLPSTGVYIVIAESFYTSTGGFNLTVR